MNSVTKKNALNTIISRDNMNILITDEMDNC